MKRRPVGPVFFFRKLKDGFSAGTTKRSFDRFVDKRLVWIGWMPERIDGAGKVLHISDTPTSIYRYLSRLLRRVNPSIVVHTGDLADDIKLEMYPAESERYRAAVNRLLNILLAPHRRVILVMGNHDKRELLPELPPQCSVCERATALNFHGAGFRISHYIEGIAESPAQFNLFGHRPEPASYIDAQERYYLNGMELMRLIDPLTLDIQLLDYPRHTEDARLMRKSGRL